MKKILQFIFGKTEAQKWDELKDEVIGTDKKKEKFAKLIKQHKGGYPMYFESGSKTIQPGYDQYGIWQEGSIQSWGSN